MSAPRTTPGPMAALPHMMRKELLQLRRDRRMLPMVLVAPVVQLILLGYAATLDVVEVRVAVVDRDHSPASRALIGKLNAADNMVVTHLAADENSAIGHLERTEADVVCVIPEGLGRDLARGQASAIHTIVDGTDSVAAGLGAAYSAVVIASFGAEAAAAQAALAGLELPHPVEVRPRVLYNEQLTSRNFMVPAVLAMVLMIFTAVLTSMAIVREKEVGTMEQLIVTPISPAVLLLGKLLPFVVIGLVQTGLVVAVVTLWFHVPLRGSVALLFALSGLFVINTLAIGLFVSTISRTQQQAMMTVIFLFFMPMMFLSGFVFPIENMPAWIQWLTYAVPMRYFLTIVRGVFLKGVGLEALWQEALGLAVIGVVLFSAAVMRFRKRLD